MQKQYHLAHFCQLAAFNLIDEIQFILAENESDGCSGQ